MIFTYQARDVTGRVRDGEITAASSEDATKQLRQDGMYLLSIEEANAGKSSGPKFNLFQKRVTRKDIIYFTNQLAVMIDAGVPLSDALEGLGEQHQNPVFRETIRQVQRSVTSGDDLSTGLAKFPKLFDSAYVNLVKASEASGTLAQMLDRISIQTQQEQETRSKVKGAMMYPGAMLTMCLSVSAFLLAYVFPKLTPLFKSKNMELPGPTKFLMALSESIVGFWFLYLIGIAALIVGFLYGRKQTWGRQGLDWFCLRIPVLGPMFQKVALGRSLRCLATTINAGVPVLEAIELSGGVSNNFYYEQTWRDVAEKVTTGKQIHEALEGNKLFPPTVQQMISSGEATGKLGKILNKVSDYYEREIQHAIKAATALIEPVMVFIMGGVIGTIALAMLLPIFKLSSGGH